MHVQVTRKVINNKPHIITDAIYQDDTVGIDLTLLNTMNTKKITNISVIPIDYVRRNFINKENIIRVITELTYNVKTEKIEVIATAAKQYDSSDSVTYVREISDEVFATELYNTCLIERKTIKNLSCFKNALNEIIEEVKNNALANDTLAKDSCLNYKCYLYQNSGELVGVANRLLESNDKYILGEFVGQPLVEYWNQDLYIDICVNNSITLRLTGVQIEDSTNASCSYALLNTNSSKIARTNVTYDNIEVEIPNKLLIPEFNSSLSINDLHSLLTIGNDPALLEKYIKQNKPRNNAKINLNKYLIW